MKKYKALLKTWFIFMCILSTSSSVFGLDTTQLCSSGKFQAIKALVRQVPKKLSSEYSIEKTKSEDYYKIQKEKAPLPPLFKERFKFIEKSIFGKNDVFEILATNQDPELGVRFQENLGIAVHLGMAAKILKQHPKDSKLIDFVIAHELGHFLQDRYEKRKNQHIALVEIDNLTTFNLPESATFYLKEKKRSLERLTDEARQVVLSAAAHAETNFYGLAILSNANIQIDNTTAEDFETVRRSWMSRHLVNGISQEIVDLLNDIEMAHLRCSIQSSK